MHSPGGPAILQLAKLQPCQSVLEVCGGSGCVIATKQRVGAIYYLAVNPVQSFVNVDTPWTLASSGLAVPLWLSGN
jgi:hypothetical protein